MNEKLLRLLELIQIFNQTGTLEDSFKAFSYNGDYQIEVIYDLIEAMETEMSYWEA